MPSSSAVIGRAFAVGAVGWLVLLMAGGAGAYVSAQTPGDADLSVSITDSPDSVMVGSTLTYTITVTNVGPGDAPGVRLDNTLPPGVFTAPSASSTQGTIVFGTVINGQAQFFAIIFLFGTIENGASATGTVQISAEAGQVGTITNTAEVSSDQDDPDTGNNSAAAVTTVVVGPTVPGLSTEGLIGLAVLLVGAAALRMLRRQPAGQP